MYKLFTFNALPGMCRELHFKKGQSAKVKQKKRASEVIVPLNTNLMQAFV